MLKVLVETMSGKVRSAAALFEENRIAPRPTATPMLGRNEGDTFYNATNPSGRYAVPEEIASLATFMVSSMGDMIVGDTFYMTGGSGTIRLHD